MRWFTPSWQAIAAILLCVLAGLLGPMTQTEMDALANPAATIDYPFFATKSFVFDLILGAAAVSMLRIPPLAAVAALAIGAGLLRFCPAIPARLPPNVRIPAQPYRAAPSPVLVPSPGPLPMISRAATPRPDELPEPSGCWTKNAPWS